MSSDARVLAEMDCFHRYYRFRLADEQAGDSRFEAWLDYKQAIQRRDSYRCHICGQVRPSGELEVRPGRKAAKRDDRLAPDNLACVCVFCDDWSNRTAPRA